MTTKVYITFFFQITLHFCHSHRCIYIDLGQDYYGLFIQNENRKRFLGICDADALQQWFPCPFNHRFGLCQPSLEFIQENSCEFDNIVNATPHCNCRGSLKRRQLNSIPNLPTCFLGGYCMNTECTLATRSAGRLHSMKYSRQFAKQPDVEATRRVRYPLNSERGKRSEITADMMQFGTNCINKLGRFADKRKLQGNDGQIEEESNRILNRILRTLHKRDVRYCRGD